MAWVRTDDNAPNHPKFFRAGVAAFGFDLAGVCYCNRNLTDGFIPLSDLPLVFPGLTMRAAIGLATKLVEVGRWQKDDERNGYAIHDYLHYQPARDRVVADRAVSRAGKVAGGLARATLAARCGGRFAPAEHQQSTSSPAGEPHQDLTSPNPNPNPKPKKEGTTLSRSRATPRGFSDESKAILGWLNEKAGKNFQPVAAHLRFIDARLETHEPWVLRKVVTIKAKEWRDDPKSRVWLRPKTLFNETNFENYVGELPAAEVANGAGE